jgi:hypothetical protein
MEEGGRRKKDRLLASSSTIQIINTCPTKGTQGKDALGALAQISQVHNCSGQ